MTDPTYDKLYETILAHLPVDDMEASRHLLDAIWPEIEARNELIRELTDFAKEQGADFGLFIEEWEENGKLDFIQLVEDLGLYGL